MKIDNVNFKGYDARPIRSLVSRDIGMKRSCYKAMIQELSSIGAKSGFDVFVQNAESVVKSSNYDFNLSKYLPNESNYVWCQDNLTFLPNGKLLANKALLKFNKCIAKTFNKTLKQEPEHIQGGNFFFVKNRGKDDTVLVGENETQYKSISELQDYFETENVIPITQPDFHLDLGIRPLVDNIVLVSDHNMLNKALNDAIERCKKYLGLHKDKAIIDTTYHLFQMLNISNQGNKGNIYQNTDKIVAELKENGFSPVKVPGSFIRPCFATDEDYINHYMANFMNGIVHQKENGDIVYLTNKSYLDAIAGLTQEVEEKIGFSFEKMFKESIKDFVKPENVHFVSGAGSLPDILEYSQGGIHCLCAEVAK